MTVDLIKAVLIKHGINPTTLAVKIAQDIAASVFSARDELIVHPSKLRDDLARLGYALFDVAQDEQLSDFDADHALFLALVGGEEFERWKERKR